jgi:hypothetical protein
MRCITMYRRQYMKQTIETQLDCRATASLQEEINQDLSQKDKSLASLIVDADEKKDTNDEQTDSSI